ncbi:hypothetical protein [Nocardia sp. NPDC005978]|uniref:hypothetical protein n=1 Tax=unclassified Nocardia TaxID=2637762 RepID=UPI0033A8DC35
MTSTQPSDLFAEQGEFGAARAAERAATARQNALASRTIASRALDAADCRYLLDMLGLGSPGTEADPV